MPAKKRQRTIFECIDREAASKKRRIDIDELLDADERHEPEIDHVPPVPVQVQQSEQVQLHVVNLVTSLYYYICNLMKPNLN